jgi:integrase
VTLLREAGVDREYVMQRVGHNTEAMTEHYTHLSDQQQLIVVTEITKLLT